MEVEVTQFILPHGRQRQAKFDLPDDIEPKYLAVQRCGCRLTAESLAIGLISLTIEEPNLGDFIIEIINSVNNIEAALAKMLSKFDEEEFDLWVSYRQRDA